MPHYQVRTKKGSIELDTYDLGEATALWQRLPNGSKVMEYDSGRGWVKIDPLAHRSGHLEPNRALARAKLETLAWEQTPEARRGRSGSRREVLLDTTDGTGMVPLSELTDFQLRRYIGPGRLEEAGDMRKNGREEDLSFDLPEYGDNMQHWHSSGGDPIYAVGSYAYSGKIHPDRDTIESALSELEGFLRKPHSSWKAADKRELRTLIAQTEEILNLQTPNARRPKDSRGLHEDEDLLRQFVEMTAESHELPNWKDAEVTPEVIEMAHRYDLSLHLALKEVVKRFPPENGATADDLWNANAPYLVLMTLRGEGVGIWDGDWDDFYSDTEPVEKLLKQRLHSYSDGSGSGSLEDAFTNAASETCGDPDYSPNARSAQADEVAARELSLYIENEYSLVGAPNSQGKAIEKNLLKKIKNGTFDLALSEKAWMYLMETGAKKYAKEYADAKDWHQIFNKPTRELVAHEFATTFYEEHKGR